MKPFGIILSAIALIAVGSWVALRKPTGSPATLLAGATQVTATSTITPIPATPTLDYLSTAQAEKAQAVTAADVSRRNELDAQQAALVAQQAAIYAQQTADGAQVAALQLTATLGAQEIERSAISATAGSVAATRQAASITDWNNRMTATVQAPSLMLTAAHAESQAAMAKYDGPVRAVSSVLFGLASVGLVVVMGFAIRGRQPAEIITEMAPLPVAHIHTSPSEAERVEPPPCTEQQWHAWSWQMLNGGSAAVGEWETFGSPFVGTEYRLGVYKWAVKHKMIGIDGPSKRQVLNDKGTAFCQEYLGATSPTEGFA
jgi:hypothetical protein